MRILRPLRLVVFALLLVALAAATSGMWLRWIGEALVLDQGPANANVAVVLAGDYTGRRIQKGADLIRQGFVPSVLVDGPAGFFGRNECDLAIDYMVRQGCPREWFLPLPMKALSTREEAIAVLDELERRQVNRFLLVTSTYHTARAARIFRSAMRKRGDHREMRVVAAPDEYFQPDAWWHSRQGRKIAFIEWSKTFAEAVGL